MRTLGLPALLLSLVFSALLYSISPSSAVIVAGANGGANNTNNTTAAQMQSSLGLGNAAFFNNVVPYSDATAVYLGWRDTPDGPRGYALSAMHITFASSITIQGNGYNVSRTRIMSSDLAVLTLSSGLHEMPTLPVISLASADPAPATGTPVIMAGNGRNRVQNATTDPFVSDAVAVADGTGYTSTTPRIVRWGTNDTLHFGTNPAAVLASANIGGFATLLFQTEFNQPLSGTWTTTNEAQAVVGDSGGGVFLYDGTLTGIMAAVSGSNVNQAAFGNMTYSINIASYLSGIQAVTGTHLIPEPNSAFLLATAAFLGLLFRKKNHRRNS